jgi:excinuclease ABC subunit C
VVLYVGKAKDLRKRAGQYFGQDKRPQLPFLVEDASTIDFIVASSELEALFLENTLIKKHNPKYNIKLKDDKNYAFIAIDYSTQIPQIGYVRKIADTSSFTPFVNPSASWGSGKHEHKRRQPKVVMSKVKSRSLGLTTQDSRLKTSDYFGPYSSTKKIRDTLDFIRKIFPYCANTEVSDRPCFYYHLHRCPGVCIGVISLDEYQKSLARIRLFLGGRTTEIKKELKISMHSAASRKQFELAARLRDQLRALEILDERQIAQFPSRVNYDFVSVAEMGSLYCVNLFKVRSGKLTDKENFVYNNPSQQGPTAVPVTTFGTKTATESLIAQVFAETYYTETTDLPEAVCTEHPLTDAPLLETLLKHRKGKKVALSVPRRGKARKLIKLGHLNAEEFLRKQLETDASDTDKLKTALKTLQDVLHLPALPRRIECYDMSNTQGTNPVGSMVVFVDGKPAKSEYRKFKIRTKDTPDDFAMMRETLTRRLSRLFTPPLEGEAEGVIANDKKIDRSPTSPSPSSRGGEKMPWPTPDLIVIDGGKGQLSAALEAQKQVSSKKFTEDSAGKGNYVLSTKHLALSTIPMIGLAKRIEEIFLPHNPEPVVLSHDEPALQLLQRLRDEAHRFGITFHRTLRSKQATRSQLDTVPGIGPKTKKLLKQKFGTVASIKTASLEELAAVVGRAKAEIIKKNL